MDDQYNTVVDYIYDSWGNLVSVKDSNNQDITNPNHIGLVNPFRYRSYYYDNETKLYYLNSRYYNPEMGRFINADGLVDTGTSILSHNMYTYTDNNPVNKADPSGNAPGDLFATMDAAAKDFGKYINAKSISVNKEYASFIYQVKKYSTVWNPIKLPFGITLYYPSRVYNTYYTYTEPKKGNSDSYELSRPVTLIPKIVAEIHTHAAYDPKKGKGNDVFSGTDLSCVSVLSINIICDTKYVVTPYGSLRRYDPSSGNIAVISWDMPYDSNHPERK